jgi:hypothetical protein
MTVIKNMGRHNTLEVLRLEHKDESHVKDKVDVSNYTACCLDAFVYMTVPLHLRV